MNRAVLVPESTITPARFNGSFTGAPASACTSCTMTAASGGLRRHVIVN